MAGMGALALSCSFFSKLIGDSCPMPLCLRRGLYRPSIQVKMFMRASAKDFQLRLKRPAHHLAAADIQHDRQIDKPRPGRDVGHVGHPQLVDAGGGELTLHQVRRWTLVLVALRRHAPASTPADAAQAMSAHHRSDAVVARLDPLVSEFGLDAWHAKGGIAGRMGLTDLFEQHGVGLRLRARGPFKPIVVTAVRHAQRLAQRAHGKFGLVRLREFANDMDVFSLLPANQAVAFANMSRSC